MYLFLYTSRAETRKAQALLRHSVMVLLVALKLTCKASTQEN